MRTLLLLLPALAWAGCAGNLNRSSQGQGEVVTAEGWSPIDPKDMLGTKQRSLMEAQKKAVERVVGVYISAKTRVAQSLYVDQNILAKVDGYVRTYDVLWEKQEGGFYKTKIRALVLYKKVGEDLKNLGLLRSEAPPGNPRVVVLVHAKGQPETKEDRAAGAIKRAFLDRGLTVVDRSDPKLADLIVRGEAETYQINNAPIEGFHSCRARLDIEVLRAVSNEVVLHKSQEASGLDPSEDIAKAKALDNAGMLAGEAIASQLADILRSSIHVSLVVLGAGDLSGVQQIAEDVRLLPEVSAVTLSEYRKGDAQLAVTTEQMPGDELAAALLRMKKHAFTVREVTPYSVEVSVGQ